MPASEIDDIFSGKVSKLAVSKGKEKASTEVASAPSSKKSKKRKQRDVDAVADEPIASSSEPLKAKKAKKKSAAHADAGDGEEKVNAKPIRVVETVRDLSAGVATLASSAASRGKFKKSGTSDAKNLPSSAKAKSRKDEDPEEEHFKDSRGSGPRKRTDDGFLVYKEDELGIKDEGGDTPLCPFDCNCCF
ncbi:hypothetical protein M0805_003463 [Coniferiporia weirii]|nr:hypothetical protein M0805_003463 [Coniferiporia weirii]